METLKLSTAIDATQRSEAAVEVPPATDSTAPESPRALRQGRAPDTRPTHKRKGRIDRRVQAYRIRAAREAEVLHHLGGPDNVTVLQEALARRWTTLDLRASQMESDAAAGRPFDLASFVAITDRLHSLSRTLGLERRAKPLRRLADILAEADE